MVDADATRRRRENGRLPSDSSSPRGAVTQANASSLSCGATASLSASVGHHAVDDDEQTALVVLKHNLVQNGLREMVHALFAELEGREQQVSAGESEIAAVREKHERWKLDMLVELEQARRHALQSQHDMARMNQQEQGLQTQNASEMIDNNDCIEEMPDDIEVTDDDEGAVFPPKLVAKTLPAPHIEKKQPTLLCHICRKSRLASWSNAKTAKILFTQGARNQRTGNDGSATNLMLVVHHPETNQSLPPPDLTIVLQVGRRALINLQSTSVTLNQSTCPQFQKAKDSSHDDGMLLMKVPSLFELFAVSSSDPLTQ